jgi:hypothetical protein
MGIKGSTTGELTFDDARVPAENLLGEEGEGFRIAMRILDRSRPGVAAQGLGIAQGATDYALEYAKTRETMGKPIGQHQLVAAMLADMETKCEAARGLLYKFGAAVDEGIDGPELTKLSAMTKLYCTDVAMEVTTDAVQVLGGYGYISEYPLERMMRDAKITQIYEGTNQIQRSGDRARDAEGAARVPARRRRLTSGGAYEALSSFLGAAACSAAGGRRQRAAHRQLAVKGSFKYCDDPTFPPMESKRRGQAGRLRHRHGECDREALEGEGDVRQHRIPGLLPALGAKKCKHGDQAHLRHAGAHGAVPAVPTCRRTVRDRAGRQPEEDQVARRPLGPERGPCRRARSTRSTSSPSMTSSSRRASRR